jgi:hypothetical protein
LPVIQKAVQFALLIAKEQDDRVSDVAQHHAKRIEKK